MIYSIRHARAWKQSLMYFNFFPSAHSLRQIAPIELLHFFFWPIAWKLFSKKNDRSAHKWRPAYRTQNWQKLLTWDLLFFSFFSLRAVSLQTVTRQSHQFAWFFLNLSFSGDFTANGAPLWPFLGYAVHLGAIAWNSSKEKCELFWTSNELLTILEVL